MKKADGRKNKMKGGYIMSKSEKAIERAKEAREYFCKIYGVAASCVVWCGGEKYIIVKDETEIKIGF